MNVRALIIGRRLYAKNANYVKRMDVPCTFCKEAVPSCSQRCS